MALIFDYPLCLQAKGYWLEPSCAHWVWAWRNNFRQAWWAWSLTLPAASRTPVSHSSMSAAEFGAEDLLSPLRQVRISLERREERKVPALLAMICHSVADQLEGRPELILLKLIH